MSSTIAELRQGAAGWIIAQLSGLLAALNTDLAAKVTPNTATQAQCPPFVVQVGDTVSAGVNKLCVTFSGDRPARTASDQKAIALTFKVTCLIPAAGDDTSANFEMARQVAADHVTTIFDDDALVISPTVAAGLLGNIKAMSGERGPIVDIFPRLMGDGVTVVRGWQMAYDITFSLKTR